MKIKLTFKENILKFFCFGYLVNERSKEIHKLKDKHVNCHTDMIVSKHFVTKKQALNMIDGQYDGCKFCWKEMDNHKN